MKKYIVLALTVLMVLGLVGGVTSARWAGIFEGNGIAHHDDGTTVTDIGWNFRLDTDNYIYGRMNFVEKVAQGENNHYVFNLQKESIDAGEITQRPILFDTANDEVRVEGLGEWRKPSEENEIVYLEIHLRGANNTTAPNTIYYRVWNADKSENYVDTGRIPITY